MVKMCQESISSLTVLLPCFKEQLFSFSFQAAMNLESEIQEALNILPVSCLLSLLLSLFTKISRVLRILDRLEEMGWHLLSPSRRWLIAIDRSSVTTAAEKWEAEGRGPLRTYYPVISGRYPSSGWWSPGPVRGCLAPPRAPGKHASLAEGCVPAREQVTASPHGPGRETTMGGPVTAVLHFSAASLSSTRYSLASDRTLSIVSAPEWEIALQYIV